MYFLEYEMWIFANVFVIEQVTLGYSQYQKFIKEGSKVQTNKSIQ